MAVIATKGSTKVALTLKVGVDASGNDTTKVMNLSKIKVTAPDANLFAAAKAIEPLLKFQVTAIEKADSYLLAEV